MSSSSEHRCDVLTPLLKPAKPSSLKKREILSRGLCLSTALNSSGGNSRLNKRQFARHSTLSADAITAALANLFAEYRSDTATACRCWKSASARKSKNGLYRCCAGRGGHEFSTLISGVCISSTFVIADVKYGCSAVSLYAMVSMCRFIMSIVSGLSDSFISDLKNMRDDDADVRKLHRLMWPLIRTPAIGVSHQR